MPGAMKTRMLLDYSSYMTQLIGMQSCNLTPSPCQSDKGSPMTQKKVNEQHFYSAFRCIVKGNSAVLGVVKGEQISERFLCSTYPLRVLLILPLIRAGQYQLLFHCSALTQTSLVWDAGSAKSIPADYTKCQCAEISSFTWLKGY